MVVCGSDTIEYGKEGWLTRDLDWNAFTMEHSGELNPQCLVLKLLPNMDLELRLSDVMRSKFLLDILIDDLEFWFLVPVFQIVNFCGGYPIECAATSTNLLS